MGRTGGAGMDGHRLGLQRSMGKEEGRYCSPPEAGAPGAAGCPGARAAAARDLRWRAAARGPMRCREARWRRSSGRRDALFRYPSGGGHY
jgi:hypothetical protein